MIRARVTADGRVVDTAVLKSSGVSSLDRAAIDAVSRWRFRPGRRHGLAVEMDIALPVRFVVRQRE